MTDVCPLRFRRRHEGFPCLRDLSKVADATANIEQPGHAAADGWSRSTSCGRCCRFPAPVHRDRAEPTDQAYWDSAYGAGTDVRRRAKGVLQPVPTGDLVYLRLTGRLE